MAGLTNMVRDSSQPGLFVNERWSPGSPGMYAVIIGVSTYKYLAGGVDPAPNTYGLEQLAVSALTSCRLFDWLTTEYYAKDCPLAKCWLLLSPTKEELKHEPKLVRYTDEANFATCERALGFFHLQLHQLDSITAADSRAFFFFSGHGLQTHGFRQILLPCDYLEPPARNANKAISTENLQFAMASSQVSQQFFCMDACRNDVDELQRLGLEGTKVLTERPSSDWNPILNAPVLYATSSGTQAWQQPTPDRGLSLFGQSLLDGLRGTPNIQLHCGRELCSIRLSPLQTFVEASVIQQLVAAGTSQRQAVRRGGNSGELDVTWLRSSSLSELADVPVRPTPTKEPPVTASVAMASLANLNAEFTDAVREVPSNVETANVGSEWWRREEVTRIWRSLKVLSLTTREPLGPSALELQNVAVVSNGTGYRVALTTRPDEQKGFWAELQDNRGRWFGVVLPTDNGRPLRFMLEMDVSEDGRSIVDISVQITGGESDSVQAAVALWNRYQTGDMIESLRFYEAANLRDIVFLKAHSPMAATIAALVLLRANRHEMVPDEWLANLTNWFPEAMDPPVIFAEKLFRRKSFNAAAEVLLLLRDRGLPTLEECISYAASLTLRLVGLEQLNPELHNGLRQLQRRLDLVTTRLRLGGMLAIRTGYPNEEERPWPFV